MKSFFNKIKISTWPLIFLLLVLSLVFLLFLIAEKYIYTIIIFGIIIFVSFKIKVPKFSLVLFILSMLTSSDYVNQTTNRVRLSSYVSSL